MAPPSLFPSMDAIVEVQSNTAIDQMTKPIYKLQPIRSDLDTGDHDLDDLIGRDPQSTKVGNILTGLGILGLVLSS